MQLSYISQREGGGPKAVEAADAAHAVLMALGTDASHGMLPETAPKKGDELDEHQAVTQHKAQTSSGWTSQQTKSPQYVQVLGCFYSFHVVQCIHHIKAISVI